MDLIQMLIATRPDTTPVAAWPNPLALKDHDFPKQEIKNLFNTGIIHKSMSLWASPIVVVKNHTLKGSPQQFQLCVDYRKLNSYLPTITPATGTNKGALTLMPLPKMYELFTLLKGAEYFTALELWSGYYHIKLDEESIPKSAFMTVFRKYEFLRLPFGLSQGPDFFICLIYNLFGLGKTSTNSQGFGYLAYLDAILIYSKTEKEH